MIEYVPTKWWAAWIAPNGRSYFKKPQRLYESDWGSTDYWHKGGNDCIPIDSVGGFAAKVHANGFYFTSENKDDVALVIEASGFVLRSIARSWGFKVKP